MKKRIVLIINPASGTGRQHRIIERAEAVVERNRFDGHFYFTNGPGDGKRQAQKAIEEGVDTIVAVGGDGTINEIASELINKDIELAIIPTGSGNGFARHLALPLNIDGALRVLNHSYAAHVDAAEFNGRPFFNVSGMGFDAFVGYIFATLKDRGFWNYVRASLRAFLRFKVFKTEIISNGEVLYSGNAYMVSIANTSQFGNNLYINPLGRTYDGRIEVAVMLPFARWKAPLIVYRLFLKTIHKSPYVKFWSVEAAEIKTERPVKTHIDGEVGETVSSASVKVLPGALRVLVPDKMSMKHPHK
jgi:YegS/Rv2252/BmrU family lipid kinase